jgi:hypothetical protein
MFLLLHLILLCVRAGQFFGMPGSIVSRRKCRSCCCSDQQAAAARHAGHEVVNEGLIAHSCISPRAWRVLVHAFEGLAAAAAMSAKPAATMVHAGHQ